MIIVDEAGVEGKIQPGKPGIGLIVGRATVTNPQRGNFCNLMPSKA